ncbi:LmbE family N-acetylglucosaminyl deacetylase [Rhodococcus fascians]|uniref:PIG-L deacetylase family protein n=1 Tax=Nocardiaceae TaxID=85025 RepID=UPI0015C5A221|nr:MULTISPECIES: PIG-L family deacetylase [Rhodococcus]MBJ7350977.1 PIG-L family deacetylase [Rhodococcus sp. (in: high G+C Gram-positive bacteria)]MDP9637971.1 LmbE family N-acetylglucosaminyl deacetylase [Rhodococcus cercidiphylli]MDQ0280997.1 LmbE family N-acetylglucosaminyl deacetylase [Rhodococcus fascians]MDR6909551.1 LmbE family N-acetylglucosaminyl deacetylase [Rhodococcus sp. 3258]MDR6931803.1 LmbE family N-acetylglucosaminyl deacetylase [Rhodococcus fascians]
MVENAFDADVDLGTAESDWLSADWSIPGLHWSDVVTMVVVAPHPDDEVLGVGGLLSMAAAAGVDVRVVAVTDGDGSHPGSPTVSAEDLRALRPVESERALAELGIVQPPTRLQFTDGEVEKHEDALARALVPLLDATPGTWCLTPWRGDGHPDHEATARACLTAAAVVGIPVVEYPIWMWHWATPEHRAVPWSRSRRIDLPAHAVEAKRASIERFESQIRPLSDHPADRAVLPPHILTRFRRPFEVVFA